MATQTHRPPGLHFDGVIVSLVRCVFRIVLVCGRPMYHFASSSAGGSQRCASVCGVHSDYYFLYCAVCFLILSMSIRGGCPVRWEMCRM